MKNPDSPLISICIANFNGAHLIGPCLDSVYSQVCGAPIEVIVHDDASTDDSVKFIEEHYPQVKLIVSSQNIGFCRSNNLMARHAQGVYLLLVNNDAMLREGALDALLSRAKALDRPSILGLPQFDMTTGSLVERGFLLDPFLNPVPNTDPERKSVGFVSGACLWILKSLWDEVGGFPECFHHIAEDTYLCTVARLRGFPVEVVNKSGFDHWIGSNIGGGRVTDGRLATTYSRRYHSERNKCYVMLLCYPLPLLIGLFPLHLIFLIMEGFILSLIKKDPRIWGEIYASTIWAALRKRHRLLHERLYLQQKRSVTLKEFMKPFIWYPYKVVMLYSYRLPEIT